MPGIARETIPANLQSMKQARQPIVDDGAATSLSARCEEAGGGDLIVIYESGRHRILP